MSKLSVDEQEHVSKIKYFWSDFGKYIIILLSIIIAIYVMTGTYNWYKQQQSKQATIIYAKLNDSAITNNTKYSIAIDLQNKFPKTEYAILASLAAAKIAINNKDFVKAEQFLNWVINNNNVDLGLSTLAQLDLVYLYIDQKKNDKALNLIKQKHDSSFDVLFYQAKGDLYIVSGNIDKAKAAYNDAISKAGKDNTFTQAIQVKLDVLGG